MKLRFLVEPVQYFVMQTKFHSLAQYFSKPIFNKRFFGSFLILASTVYTFYLTYLGSLWRIDPHHDGYTFLSAYLGTYGVLPPLTTNHHGIAAPLIESKFLLLTSTSLINHRFFGLIVICITALIIFRIIEQRLGLWLSSIFTLLWLNANPSWAGSMKDVPNQLQSLWPNMWIQLLTVLAIFIIFNRNQLGIFHQITLGILLGSIPFFRIQGLIISVLVYIFIYIKFQKGINLIAISGFLTVLFWFGLIQVNGGFEKYFINIFVNPFTVSDYAPWRSPESIFLNLAHKAKYFVVIALFILFLIIIISLIKKYTYTNNESYTPTEITAPFLILLTVYVLTSQNKMLWWNSLYDNFSIILIESAIGISFIYASITLIRFVKTRNLSLNKHQKELFFLSSLVLVNLINQFPLSDRGHKWWASAPSILLLACFLNTKSNLKSKYLNKTDLMSSFKILALITISFSFIEGRIFQQINRNEIANYEYANFNGLQYPLRDSESVNNLLGSVKVLTELENQGVSIDYLCEDGLYYIRKNKSTVVSLSALDKNIDTFPSPVKGIVFYCNSGIYKIPLLPDFNIYRIGKDKTDLFIAPKNDVFTNSVLRRLLDL